MKLRIKGNSLRMRLTKTEVSKLASAGYLEEQTVFAGNKFIYALQVAEDATELSAALDANTITMFVPRSFVQDWPVNNVVGCDAHMHISETETLYLLLEKDFVCLDETHEDQADNFENPNKTC
ncbi:MAG: hypothetical protein IPL50_09765 [Chitinophagaceae bacterium]|nr:hypothetical protein [Chitinophagaceae bacterium]